MGGQMRGYLVSEFGKIDQRIVATCDVEKRQRDRALKAKGSTDARAQDAFRNRFPIAFWSYYNFGNC